MEGLAGEHAGGEVTGPEALGGLDRESAIGGRTVGIDPGGMADVVEDLLAPPQRARHRSADPRPGPTRRLVLRKKRIEGERVLDLSRGEAKELGHLDDGLERHVPQAIVDDVQGRQRQRAAVGVTGRKGLDLRNHLGRQDPLGGDHGAG